VYSQRQPGVHMIRTKIPGGIMTADQMDVLAAVADEFAEGKGHLTTRQNMQYHFIPLPRVADLLHRLADARMTTREACYNTVRNVTASPLSGLLADEVFDVQPYVRLVSLAFLHNELTDSMPRKFKIAFFSGGKLDNMALAIHDFGATAVIRDGKRMTVQAVVGKRPTEEELAQNSFDPDAQQGDPDGFGGKGKPSAGPVVQQALGIAAIPLTPQIARQLGASEDAQGVVISAVDASADAAAKGLQRGDIVLSANYKPVATAADLEAVVRQAKAENREAVLLRIQRRGQPPVYMPIRLR
jgi:membrane-associated protease RseP (regulator of RpoE activity)